MKNDGSNIVPFKPGGPVDANAPLPAISPKRQDRIWKTQDLFLGGMKVTELATYFGISRKQVYKDLADAGRLAQALVRDFDSEGTLGREIRLLEELRRKAMRNFSTARQEGVKLGFLRLALKTTSRLVALFQTTGLMTVVPWRIAFEESNPFTSKDFRHKFAALLLEAREAGEPIQGL